MLKITYMHKKAICARDYLPIVERVLKDLGPKYLALVLILRVSQHNIYTPFNPFSPRVLPT